MDTQVRLAALDDKDAILALMVDVIQTAIEAPHQAETVRNATSNLEFWAQQPERSLQLVATSHDRIVGVVLVKEFWNLCSLFVWQPAQRSGIGRRLAQAALEACRSRSPISAVYLNAAPGAVDFYRKLGFGLRESKQKLPPGFLPMSISLAEPE